MSDGEIIADYVKDPTDPDFNVDALKNNEFDRIVDATKDGVDVVGTVDNVTKIRDLLKVKNFLGCD